jgi:predicted lipoprotein with Yx(FWY)xxD motif
MTAGAGEIMRLPFQTFPSKRITTMPQKKTIAIAALGALAVASGFAAHAEMSRRLPTTIKLESTKLGNVYATSDGMTVYEFKKDHPHSHKSTCYGECATLWPPIAAPAGFKPFKPWGIAIRKGGEKELTYQGYPLYTWVKDTKPGDVTGQGVKGVWRVAKPGKTQISWTAMP